MVFCNGIYILAFNSFLNLMIFFSISATALAQKPDISKDQANNKDWVFINYTYKRFEGLPKSWQSKS